MKSFLLFISLLSLSFVRLHAQMINHEDVVKVKFSVDQQDGEGSIVATVEIIPGWHINSHRLPKGSYAIPTDLIIKPINGITPGKLTEPKPHQYVDKDLGDLQSHHKGKVILRRAFKINSPKDVKVKGAFSFQVCDEAGKCLLPREYPFELTVKAFTLAHEEDSSSVQEMVDTAKTSTVVKKNSVKVISEKKEHEKKGKSLLFIFILSFISGFAALLTPCVFPMIPMTVSFFTKQSQSKAAGIRNALLYGISIIIIYVLLGTVITAIFGPSALNELSTNVWFNLIFFLLLVVFAISFMGAFEITLPNSWLNKANDASYKGGLLGIFFMALALALVSFSCTGPIVGTLLVESATIGGMAPFVGMFGFSMALALPFTLFAAFPGWMNSLPKSGGWLNTVKVVLGFLELALAFKFLSNADLVIQGHYLEREVFLAIWIGIFLVLSLYLLGFVRLPHDNPIEKLSVGRTLLGTTVLMFVIYLIPGLWGAPLKLISGFPPPLAYSEAPQGFGGSKDNVQHAENPDMHLGPQNLQVFHDFDKAKAYAEKVNKPLFVDFTGHACVNCRKMEEKVWGEPGIIEILRKKMVIVSLYVDEKTELPKSDQGVFEYAPGKTMNVTQVGHKWSLLQAKRYKSNTQPYYRMIGKNDQDLSNGSADYEHNGTTKDFQSWLEAGLKDFASK